MIDLPQLNPQEQSGVTRIKRRYDYHRVDGLLLEDVLKVYGYQRLEIATTQTKSTCVD
ncbi:MAG: hypothetical protein PT120_25820 [Aphanizomenon gracile PMC649.10]|nr:hypothetical protein [Aphanizomenon gracile PMC627.10]MDM3858207.1 hypothetical protein [Aphanizomenon gracile PMC649.10]